MAKGNPGMSLPKLPGTSVGLHQDPMAALDLCVVTVCSWLNLHRPCMFATNKVNGRGKPSYHHQQLKWRIHGQIRTHHTK